MKCIECSKDAAASISDESNECSVHVKYYCSEHYWSERQ